MALKLECIMKMLPEPTRVSHQGVHKPTWAHLLTQPSARSGSNISKHDTTQQAAGVSVIGPANRLVSGNSYPTLHVSADDCRMHAAQDPCMLRIDCWHEATHCQISIYNAAAACSASQASQKGERETQPSPHILHQVTSPAAT